MKMLPGGIQIHGSRDDAIANDAGKTHTDAVETARFFGEALYDSHHQLWRASLRCWSAHAFPYGLAIFVDDQGLDPRTANINNESSN